MLVSKKIAYKKLVSKIKKELKKEGIYQRGSISSPKNYNNYTKQIRSDIELFLITARNYSDPTILLPRNPFLRFIKYILLLPIKKVMKTQSVFNRNILYAIEQMFIYMSVLEKKIINSKRIKS